MKKFTYYSIMLLMAFILITSNVKAQNNDGITILKEYLNALEEFQFEKAYGYILPEDQKYKNLETFKTENPIVLFKALRIANKDFFKFSIVNEDAKTEEIILKTLNLDVPDDLTYMLLSKLIISEISKSNNEGLDPQKPEDILNVLKAMFKEGMKLENIPFKPVEKKIKVVKSANKLYVNPGWKEAFLAKEKAAKALEIKLIKEKAERNASFIIDNAKRFGNYQETLDKLKKLQTDVPDSEIINGGLALLTEYISNIKMIKLKVLDAKENFTGNTLEINVELKNESKLKIASVQILFSHFDEKHNLLIKEGGSQIFTCGDFTWEPPSPDGCEPGYTGKWMIMTNKPQNWAVTEVEFKSVTFLE